MLGHMSLRPAAWVHDNSDDLHHAGMPVWVPRRERREAGAREADRDSPYILECVTAQSEGVTSSPVPGW